MLYYVVNSGPFGEPVPLSLEAFIEPFSSIVAIAIGVIAVLDMVYYHVSVLPMAAKTPKLHMLAVVFPEVVAIMGFIIGFMHLNFWVALPFFALGFANTLYAYSRISEISA